jgi:glycine dehydrogenase
MEFAARHIGPSQAEQDRMLAALGYTSLDELTSAALPDRLAGADGLSGLPAAMSEAQALHALRGLAAENEVLTSMIGLGYHGTITPAVIRRNVLENPAWYTAYTPYQPEISQGRLEALLNFQTVVEDLTGLAVAGASLLDEATAAAEAMTLARRAARKGGGNVFLADARCLPQTLAVLATRAKPLGIDLVVAPVTEEEVAARPEGEVFGVLLPYPDATGEVRDLRPVIAAAARRGALTTVAADPLALTLLMPPGELGADIAIGSTQRFGVPMGYGGPHAAYIAVRAGLERQLPGRLVGVSVDAAGQPAYRLALQAREQHIRRERATSNICTAQVLLAVVASMYAVYHGPDELTAIARRVHRRAAVLAATLRAAGCTVAYEAFFDTVAVSGIPGGAAAGVERARRLGYNLYLAGPDTVQAACDETTTEQQLRDVVAALSGMAPAEVSLAEARDALPAGLRRDSAFLTHPVFHQHRSETAMLRYLRRLADFDIALDRSMIPLGSCTMKLNATAEMEPITWPRFADMHPFAPPDQARGYARLIAELSAWLAEITGYAAVSLQPNAGSQGELSGLLAIRAYHTARGEQDRDICLIPESAHGTNAASAVLAGLRVVVVKCGGDGAVDVGDLRAKLSAHEGKVAAIMLTYPSTHGVFEETVTDVCAAVHDAGGQVYVDGANLNALMGLAKPGRFGADVSHLNLHKTFCIPHGGGGPGVGPVAVGAHLAPFLPGSPVPGTAPAAEGGTGPVAAAPYGSAGILPISWAFIAMMGADGLRRASQVAVLSANYIARKLSGHYPVLYTGRNGLVAHECIVDLRPLTREAGVTVEDVAKRLIDYGLHAPTMSFPVAGTLMIEPTESEDLAEIERFCAAMISIREEIARVASGDYDRQDNPLGNAPHTAPMLLATDWKHHYTREEAAYPLGGDHRGKYWPPVRRIDQAYGDRHLVCACPPPEAFED